MFGELGQHLSPDLRERLLDLCRKWAWCVEVWDGDRTRFWPMFFVSVEAALESTGPPTADDLTYRFRGSAPYKAWTRRVSVQVPDTWSTTERGEIEQWPEGRVADARIAAWLLDGESAPPDVRRWVDRFNVKALAHCLAWRHPFQDAQELIGDFWVWALKTQLFSKYSPARGSLFHFVFRCFKHEFLDWGRHAESERARQDTLDDQSFATPSDALSPLDVLVSAEKAGPVQECLHRLGMGVGEAGWLLWQIDLMGNTYEELVDDVFQGAVKAGTLRTRATRARHRFKALWNRGSM